jgi:hypothetical protein
LDAAHELGLVHRDVKPGNVLISRSRGSEAGEHVYLSDFGLTKRSASDSGITGTGQFVGTLDYAAPEQFTGKPADARTDVYSLGCVLFECLTGRPPFVSENDAGMMYAHLQEEPPRVTADRPELPAAIDRVVAAAMAKDPAARQPSAGVLAEEASRALEIGGPAPAGAPRRGIRAIAVAAAVVVALVAGVAIASLPRDEGALAEDTPSPTSSPSPTPSPSPDPTFRTVERPFSSEEERLLTYIPEEVATGCLPLDRGEPIRGELAALACRTADVEVLYELFPTRDLMNAAFQVNANVMRAPDGECATDALAVTPYSVGGDPAGRVLCYVIVGGDFATRPDQSHIEWTDENASIYAHAVRNDLGDLSLYAWWVTSAGPVIPGGGTKSKDPPPGGLSAPLEDGTYLVAPSDGCAGFAGSTCALHVAGGSYTDVISPDFSFKNETGTVLQRKPNAVVFMPTSGYCVGSSLQGGGGDPRPATYSWSVKDDRVSFVRTSGGQCAGPQKMDRGEPWTKAPEGLIALEQGGSIEFIDPGGQLVGSTSTPLVSPNWPDWSPDGERIAFSGATPGGFDLFVMDADGSAIVPISESAGIDEVTPAWSPDGSRIAFVAEGLSQPDWTSRLIVMDPVGSERTEVLVRQNESLFTPAWSHDGGRIAFTLFEADQPFAYVVDDDGANPTRLADDPAVVLSWTLDGERILIAAGGEIHDVLPDGSEQRVFMDGLPEGISRPVLDLDPAGEWMVLSNASGVTPAYVYLIRMDGSETFMIATGSEPDWRPTG